MFLRKFPVGTFDYFYPEDEYLENCDFEDEEYYQEENMQNNENFDEENEEYYDEHYECEYEEYQYNQQEIFYCDSCDKDFYSKSQYDKHMSEHTTCNLDGCTFTAHVNIIEKHVLMQHATGLYDKIRNINTPEDIAKWLEDRKKRYPNKENILKRQEKQEEMLKRGERIKKNNNRFGRDKYRLTKSKDVRKQPPKKKPKRPFVKEKKPISLINEKIDWKGSVFPFRGTSSLESEPVKESSDYEDNEWAVRPSKPVEIKLNNALGALMGAYMSGSDTENEDVKPTQIIHEENKDVVKEVEVPLLERTNRESDEEPPTEVKIQKEIEPPTMIETKEINPVRKTNKRKRPDRTKRNKFKFTKNKRFARKQRFHVRDNQKDNFPYGFKKRKVTLLEKLLKNEIRHERNVLLQCIRHIVSNNCFIHESLSTV